MDLNLDGRCALVTGSSSGIGAGIARCLTAEGAAVVVHGRNRDRTEAVAREIREAGGITAVALGDLETETGAEAVVEAALKAFGGIDILVNNAGGTQNPVMGWFGMPFDDWLGTYNKNVGSSVRLVRRLADPMKERGWGRIVQIGSYSGHAHIGTNPAYAASKAAVANLTLGLSKWLKFTGVTVNTVTPGLIETPNLERFMKRMADARGFGDDRKRLIDYLVNDFHNQCVARLGTPGDVGAMVAFLCSAHADFITGANIRVDGGAAPHV